MSSDVNFRTRLCWTDSSSVFSEKERDIVRELQVVEDDPSELLSSSTNMAGEVANGNLQGQRRARMDERID